MQKSTRKPFSPALSEGHRKPVFRRYLPLMGVLCLLLVSAAAAQNGFATTEITDPIKKLVSIANAAIAGLAVLTVIFFCFRWFGGDEGAPKKIIVVILAAVVALGAANFLGFVTGRAEFEAVQ